MEFLVEDKLMEIFKWSEYKVSQQQFYYYTF